MFVVLPFWNTKGTTDTQRTQRYFISSLAEKDSAPPIILIHAPLPNAVYTAGETIQIKGTVADNQFISQVHIEVSDHVTGEEYLHVQIHPANKSYLFDQALTAKAGARYRIKVIAEDPSYNSSSQQVDAGSPSLHPG